MRQAARLGLLAGLGLVMGACATAPLKPTLSPEPPVASVLEELVAARRQKAEALEREGRLRRALDEWKIALTINPGDAAARDGRRRLEGRIERVVLDRLSRGRKALEQGAYREARRHFLAALALDPANRVAFQALQMQVNAVRTVTPALQPGKTLIAIAERHSADHAGSELISNTNQCLPDPRLVAATTQNIPRAPGASRLPAQAQRDIREGKAILNEDTLYGTPFPGHLDREQCAWSSATRRSHD